MWIPWSSHGVTAGVCWFTVEVCWLRLGCGLCGGFPDQVGNDRSMGSGNDRSLVVRTGESVVAGTGESVVAGIEKRQVRGVPSCRFGVLKDDAPASV